MVAAALEFLEQQSAASEPFFLHFNSTLMHGGPNAWRNDLAAPNVSPDGWLDVLPDVAPYMPARSTLRDRLRAIGITDEDDLDRMEPYLWSDDSLGAILAKLDEMGPEVVRNTIFVWLSDHGSRYKASAYDVDGTRVPLMVRWPAQIPAGSVSNTLVQTLDLVPTFLDVARTAPPPDDRVDGRSLLPVFAAAGGARPDWRTSVFIEIGEARAVRTSDGWKYVALRPRTDIVADALDALRRDNMNRLIDRLGYIHRTLDRRAQEDHPEYFSYDLLYDLNSDPTEVVDLAASPMHQTKLEQMKALLTGYLAMDDERPFGQFLPDRVPGSDAADPGLSPGTLAPAFERAREYLFGAP